MSDDKNRVERAQEKLDNAGKNAATAGCALLLLIGAGWAAVAIFMALWPW